MKLPPARTADIIVQEAGIELLVYDLTIHRAYHLNKTSKIIYHYCDGKTSFDELKSRHNFTDDLIFLALEQLEKENLLLTGHFGPRLKKHVSRRTVTAQIGLSLAALPVITSLVAPTAAVAQSVRAACGNGLLDQGEECDDGNLNNIDGCTNSCRTNVCGNGRVDANEQCDDGGVSSGDGCSATCQIEIR